MAFAHELKSITQVCLVLSRVTTSWLTDSRAVRLQFLRPKTTIEPMSSDEKKEER
jgi:hypothetical protein